MRNFVREDPPKWGDAPKTGTRGGKSLWAKGGSGGPVKGEEEGPGTHSKGRGVKDLGRTHCYKQREERNKKTGQIGGQTPQR